MHDEIKKFSINGEIQDRAVLTVKDRLVFFVETMMRDKGFVPSLDLDPQFTIDYIPDRELFAFDLTVYGVAVGKDESCKVSGIASGRKVVKYMPRTK